MRKPTPERKAEIVNVALAIADVGGVGALSTTAIAARIGISQPAIFRHFPTKADLWTGVAERLIDEMTARWEPVLASDTPPRARLLAMAQTQLAFITLRPAVLDIVFSRQLHHENPALKARFRDLMAALVAQFDALYAAMQPQTPPALRRDAVLVLVGTIHATALRWSLSNKGFDLVAEGLRLIEGQLPRSVHDDRA